MKNITYLLGLILVLGVISSCTKEEDENPFASIEPKGAVVSVGNVQTGFFDLTDPDNAGIAFDLTTKGEAVNSVTVLQSTKGGAPQEIATISSFPATISVSLADIMASSGLTMDDLAPGDQTVFSFQNVSTPSGTYPSGASLSIDMSCQSDLGGMMDVTTVGWCGETFTGTAELVALGGGSYTVADMSFGAYEVCYGAGSALPEGDLTIVDICNELSYAGLSQWGETYEFLSMTVDGPSLTFAWKNDYDPEAGTTTLVRQDGRDWPALSIAD